MVTKKERMLQRIEKHGNDLIRVFGLPKETDAVKLCKKLRSAELKLEKLAERYCNGEITADEIETESQIIFEKIFPLLKTKGSIKVPVFFNRDPRGYALKIDDAYIRENNIDIYRDFGGYGILAPDFSHSE